MNRTSIEWCASDDGFKGYTWNPVTGCSPASAGCKNCFARVLSERRGLHWGSPVFHPERLVLPAKVRKPARVFCGSMTDLGQTAIDPKCRRAIATAMLAAPQHQYIVLTKRPGPWLRELPPECWVLVSVESQDYAARWPLLEQWAWPSAVKGVSVEPMLGPVAFGPYLTRPDWIIAGPETGPGARPCNPAWIWNLECWSVAAGVPFFDKRPKLVPRREWPRKEPADAKNS